MTQLGQKIGFIGAGNMGEAMIGALIRSGVAPPSRIFIHELREAHADALKNKYGIVLLSDNKEVLRACDVMVFAVKPQSLDQVLSDLQSKNAFCEISSRKLLITIAAGKRITMFEDYIYSGFSTINNNACFQSFESCQTRRRWSAQEYLDCAQISMQLQKPHRNSSKNPVADGQGIGMPRKRYGCGDRHVRIRSGLLFLYHGIHDGSRRRAWIF